MEQLLMKARFEEAKQKELAMVTSNNSQRRSGGQRDAVTPQLQMTSAYTTPSENLSKKSGRVKRSYFNCGLANHLIKDCPYPKQLEKDKKLASLIQQLLWSHQSLKPR